MSFKAKKIFIFLSSFVLALLLCSKANLTALTYDEAYTFFKYVLNKDIFSTSLANNHPLNTATIISTTTFGEGVLSVRLTNILFGLGYLVISCLVSVRSKLPVLTFFILTLCPYLFEFFTLARGYGLAASLVFAALATYFYLYDDKRAILISTALLVLASYAYYPVVTLSAVFVSVIGFKEWKNGNRLYSRASVYLLGICSIFPIWAMKQVSSTGKPLYGIIDYSATDVLFTGFGFQSLLNPDETSLGVVAFLFVFLPILFAPFLGKKTKTLSLMVLVFVVVFFAAAFLSGRPLPTHRLLIPFAPLLLMAAASAYGDLSDYVGRKRALGAEAGIALLLMINFISTFRMQDTYDWSVNKVVPQEVIKFQIKNGWCNYINTKNPAQYYYIRQEKNNHRPYCDQATGTVIK